METVKIAESMKMVMLVLIATLTVPTTMATARLTKPNTSKTKNSIAGVIKYDCDRRD